jgi:ribonuclease HII
VACIAAASILAKVTRDRMMVEMHQRWPEYEFAQHKGYVTPEHAAALQQHGPCPEHRASYVNVRRAAARLSLLENGWVDAVPPVDRAEEIA